jgi:tRNA nucleotidyltransferase (CCA-adding enzyme)
MRYLQRWRYVKPSLDGRALLALGAREGPALGQALRRLKAARLDGEVRTHREEERLARVLLGLSARTRP